MKDETSVVQTFISEKFGELRTVTIDGVTWFIGKYVAKALGYKDTDKAIRDHVDEADKRIFKPADLAGMEFKSFNNFFAAAGSNLQFVPTDIPNRGIYAINESGLYSLIFASQLPKAKEFKHWITSEVLPSIRKTGGYSVNASNFFNNEVSANWEKIKSAEALIKIAKLADSSNLKNQLLSEATILLTGKDFFKLNEKVYDEEDDD